MGNDAQPAPVRYGEPNTVLFAHRFGDGSVAYMAARKNGLGYVYQRHGPVTSAFPPRSEELFLEWLRWLDHLDEVMAALPEDLQT